MVAARSVQEFSPGQHVCGEFVLVGGAPRELRTSVFSAQRAGRPRERFVVRAVPLAKPRGASWIDGTLSKTQAIAHRALAPIVAWEVRAQTLLLVQRVVSQSSLRGRLRRGPLAPRAVVWLVSELADALDLLHEARPAIVHGALCPANIAFDEGASVLALEGTGLAACLGDAALRPATLETLREPGYTSPDEAAGRLHPRSDAFSLACIAYECLVGLRPFAGDDDDAVQASILTQRPSSLRALRPELDASVDEVFARALNLDRQGAFRSCAAFAEALEDALIDEPSERPTWEPRPVDDVNEHVGLQGDVTSRRADPRVEDEARDTDEELIPGGAAPDPPALDAHDTDGEVVLDALAEEEVVLDALAEEELSLDALVDAVAEEEPGPEVTRSFGEALDAEEEAPRAAALASIGAEATEPAHSDTLPFGPSMEPPPPMPMPIHDRPAMAEPFGQRTLAPPSRYDVWAGVVSRPESPVAPPPGLDDRWSHEELPVIPAPPRTPHLDATPVAGTPIVSGLKLGPPRLPEPKRPRRPRLPPMRLKQRKRPRASAAVVLGIALVVAATIITAGQIYLARTRAARSASATPPRAANTAVAANTANTASTANAAVDASAGSAAVDASTESAAVDASAESAAVDASAVIATNLRDAAAQEDPELDDAPSAAGSQGARPSRGVVIATRRRLAALVDACVGTAHPNRRVRINVVYDGATGAPTSIRVRGFFGISPLAPCIVAAVREAPLPPFGEGTWEAGHSFPTRGP